MMYLISSSLVFLKWKNLSLMISKRSSNSSVFNGSSPIFESSSFMFLKHWSMGLDSLTKEVRSFLKICWSWYLFGTRSWFFIVYIGSMNSWVFGTFFSTLFSFLPIFSSASSNNRVYLSFFSEKTSSVFIMFRLSRSMTFLKVFCSVPWVSRCDWRGTCCWIW